MFLIPLLLYIFFIYCYCCLLLIFFGYIILIFLFWCIIFDNIIEQNIITFKYCLLLLKISQSSAIRNRTNFCCHRGCIFYIFFFILKSTLFLIWVCVLMYNFNCLIVNISNFMIMSIKLKYKWMKKTAGKLYPAMLPYSFYLTLMRIKERNWRQQ